MYDLDPNTIANTIREAVVLQDHASLNQCILEFASFCFKECQSEQEPFPEPVFQTIVDLMADAVFQNMEGSDELLMVFEYDWLRLSEDQKRRLLHTIATNYAMFSGTLSHFIFSELLGEYYCNDAALEVLCELRSSTDNKAARSLLPHGFEHIAKDAEESDLRRRALEQLLSMKDDPSSEVRSEVDEALSNLGVSR